LGFQSVGAVVIGCGTQEELMADALALASRVREQLRRYFPQMLGLGNLHDAPWLWALLELCPTPARTARSPSGG
jgi:hypothetical protein